MKKKLLAVALATAFAAPAMADGVQIYGAFDVGVLARGGSDNALGANARGSGTETQVASGMNGHNGIGFRMSEDLGNGMKLSGDAMFGFALDAGGSTGLASGNSFSTIYSYLALSGDFGTVIAGRAGGARYGFIKKYDAFGGFGVGNAGQVHGGGADYADNVLAWITPEVLPGLKFLGAYTSNLTGQDRTPRGTAVANIDADNNDTQASNPLYAVAALYSNGPLDVTVAYEKAWTYSGNPGNIHVNTIGASYDFGILKVMGLFTNLTDVSKGWQIGATAPLGEATTLKVGYAYSEANGGRQPECGKMAIGVNHDVSKRTRLYADVARLTNLDTGSNCARGVNTYQGNYASGGGALGAPNSFSVDGRDNSVGYGEWGMNVGVRHTF